MPRAVDEPAPPVHRAATSSRDHAHSAPDAPVGTGFPLASTLRTHQSWYWLAGAVAAVLIVWITAYSLGRGAGQKAGEDKLRQLVANDPTLQPAVPPGVADPLNTQPPVQPPPQPGNQANRPQPAGGNTAPPKPPGEHTPARGPGKTEPKTSPGQPTTPAGGSPASPTGPTSATTSLQSGLNYLVVADLSKADAEAAAEHLKAKGLPAAVVPKRTTFQVLIVRGYTREQFRDDRIDAERTKLMEAVRKIGREWKLENRRAPTDFAQVFWAKYEG
jgi:hypothetical protein